MPAKKPTPLDKWSADYYAGRSINTSSDKLREMLQAAGLGKRPARIGLPDSFPQMTANTAGISNAEQVLRAAETAFRDGYTHALVVAMKCLAYSPALPVPRWVLWAWLNATNLVEQKVAKSLDEALGLKFARTKIDAATFKNFHAQIFLDIKNADDAGVAVGHELYYEVGQHYGGVSESTIARVYADVCAQLEQVSQND